MPSTRFHFHIPSKLVAKIVAAAAIVMLPTLASAEGLTGLWSGSGSVVLPSGATEKARCKVSFEKRGRRTYYMNAICASPSARIAQTAALEQTGANRFAGEFNNAEYGVSGDINVTLNGNSLSAALNGAGATALFNLRR